MTAHLIALVLSGCTVAIAYGVAILPHNLRDTIEATRPNPAREAEAQAAALAELLCNEIDATKRGDLPDGAVILLDECYTALPNRNCRERRDGGCGRGARVRNAYRLRPSTSAALRNDALDSAYL